MTWNNITVFQWQQLNDLYTSEDERDDLATPSIAIIKNMTETEVHSLTEGERQKILKEIDFVHTPPMGKPERYIKCPNGKRYKCVYDVREIKAGRYIETKHFGKTPQDNLHRVAASMIRPMEKRLGFWREVKYNAANHEDYANDLLTAPITAVLGSVLFFCEVYRRWMQSSKDYLVREMTEKGMSREEAEAAYLILWEFTDGITKPLWLRNTSASN